jgi:hypothetical protein
MIVVMTQINKKTPREPRSLGVNTHYAFNAMSLSVVASELLVVSPESGDYARCVMVNPR